jgi:hypothetical protein
VRREEFSVLAAAVLRIFRGGVCWEADVEYGAGEAHLWMRGPRGRAAGTGA